MKRKVLLGLIFGAAVCLFALPALYAGPAAPAAPIKMEKTKKPVTFKHDTHAKYDCKECHHKWDGAGAIQSCAAAGCHDAFDKKDKTEHSYYKAMHNARGSVSSCVSCHKDVAGKDKAKKKQLAGCAKSVCHP